MKYNELDNPVWNALNEVHGEFSLDYGALKFYKQQYGPFGGFLPGSDTIGGIDLYAAKSNNFFVVGERPEYSKQLFLNNQLICEQMVLEKPAELERKETIVPLITDRHKLELFDLINLVYPGYYKRNTADLGRYFGIYSHNKLVAVTGERMKLNDYTEISAVVTQPEYSGKGFAKQLISHVAELIFDENKLPFLHVAETNHVAIRLYESLGFSKRQKMNFWHLMKK
ncbi:MAG: GNAT family N-acetyltransferase [Saprospiraceae bacterium]|nr:GNAT family N-acetyltransferase [Saprospiraceae bacterium]